MHASFMNGLLIVLAACSTSPQTPTRPQDVAKHDCVMQAYDTSGYDDPLYAPLFTLDSLDGQRYDLEALRGCWVLINFWATYCAPCVEEMPALQAISEVYSEQMVLLGINQREQEVIVAAFAADIGISFPILINPPDALLSAYGVVSLPQTILVDPNGEIVWRQYGPVMLDTFTELLRGFINPA